MTSSSDSRKSLSSSGFQTSSSTTSSIFTSSASSTLSDNATPSTTSSSLSTSRNPSASTTSSTTSKTLITLSTSDIHTLSTEPEPTATSPSPDPTDVSNPDLTSTSLQPASFNLILDLGTCASMGSLKIIDFTVGDGADPELASLGNNQYALPLRPNGVGIGRIIAFLADDDERCGAFGSCLSPSITFDSSTLSIQVARMGATMYPFSIWADGGRLFDGTPADSQASKYNCWGWSKADCPFMFVNEDDPEYTISTSALNATAYITFCPPDGPAASSIGPDTNSHGVDTSIIATGIVLTVETVVPVSTFLAPFSTSHRGMHRPMVVTEFGPTSTTSGAVPNITPAPGAGTNDADADKGVIITASCVTLGHLKCAYTIAVIEETTTVPIGDPYLEPITVTAPDGLDTSPIVLSTYINLMTTAIVPVSTVVFMPVPTQQKNRITSGATSMPTSAGERSKLPGSGAPLTLVPLPTTLTDSLGVPIATSTISAVVIPTFSSLTDSRGSVISSIAYNLTTTTASLPSPTPPPEALFTFTSWTTHMTINGSTVPAMGGQVGVRTTVSATFVLEPDTTIALGALSSISVESTRTSIPSASASASADLTSMRRASTVTAAIVGSLVGITLLSVFLWVAYVKYKRRQQRTPDYAGYQSSVWGSRLADEPSSRDESMLDLNGGPQPRASFVEPWVERRQPPLMSRKMQREMEEHGGGLMAAGPSRGATAAGSSIGRAYNGLRPSKAVNRVPPELRPEPLEYPARNATLSSIGSSPEPDHMPAIGSTSTRSPAPRSPAPVPAISPSISSRHQHSGQPVQEMPQHNAIPPLYNEEWNTRPALSSQ